ncbi:flagellar hook-length control protein FliK [Ectopseudomonas mendocina]|uniref:Flagellar hook-length control protein FliK n=1 Tax=Ectopseudomonas mendocina TaxID=300 RepID=A0ABZ2RPE5_ECTME
MLQSIHSNAVQAAGPVPAEAVAASPLEPSGELALASFGLQLAVDEVAAESLLVGDAQPQTQAQPLPVEPAVIDAEHWLNSMLQQQAAQIEARESDLPATPLPEQSSAVVDELAELQLAAVVPSQAATQPDARVWQSLAARNPVLTGSELASPAATASAVLPSTAAVMTATGAALLTTQTAGELPVATSTDAAVLNGLSEAPQSQTAQLQSTLKLHAPQARWGEQMLQSLRETVELQINQRVQNATIRLDPPELGSLEIFLSHEAGRITVQLSAANADVARLLQQTSDRLRQELVAQNFVQVNVQVSADSQGGRQQGQTMQHLASLDEQVQAQVEPEAERTNQQDSASDVLVTV